MNQDVADALAKIEAFDLDESGVADPFSRRLARENGWSELYTSRVIREYKRFLALAVSVRHVVTPSDQVDQAWHLHLLHSARYRQFCSEILGRVLDHGPSQGGPIELGNFTLAYERTLESYAKVFGEPAPSDVWPSVAERFEPRRAAQRVSHAEYWLIRKPRFWRSLARRLPRPLLTWGRLGWSAVFCIACACSVSSHISGSEFLLGYLALWALSLGLAHAAKRLTHRREVADTDVDCELQPYELLQLAHGKERAVDGALAALLARRALAFDEKGAEFRVSDALPNGALELERRVYREVEETAHPSAQTLRFKAAQLTRDITTRLEALGLMTTGKARLPFWIALVAPGLGLVRIVSRLGSHKPIAGLVVLCVVSALVARWFIEGPQRTPRGNAVLEKARTDHSDTSASELSHAGMVPLSIALYGIGAVGLAETSSWTGWLARPPAAPHTSDGSGCGSGDGGCGGGCGGCGGCGG